MLCTCNKRLLTPSWSVVWDWMMVCQLFFSQRPPVLLSKYMRKNTDPNTSCRDAVQITALSIADMPELDSLFLQQCSSMFSRETLIVPVWKITGFSWSYSDISDWTGSSCCAKMKWMSVFLSSTKVDMAAASDKLWIITPSQNDSDM